MRSPRPQTRPSGSDWCGDEDTAPLTTLVRETDVEGLMLPGRYTLLDQSALDGLLPACQERGVSVIAAAVFHSGVLAQNRPGAGAILAAAPRRRRPSIEPTASQRCARPRA